MRKLVITLSTILLIASTYMYMNTNQSQVQFQSPATKFVFEEKPKEERPDNPYVIRHGSNAMPKGMEQGAAGRRKGIEPAGAGQQQGVAPVVGDDMYRRNQGSAGSPTESQPTGQPQSTPQSGLTVTGNQGQDSEQAEKPKPRINVEKGEGITPGSFNGHNSSTRNVP